LGKDTGAGRAESGGCPGDEDCLSAHADTSL
jgi:hypothetical protein